MTNSDNCHAASPSRRRFLQQAGATGLAGMTAPLLARPTMDAVTSSLRPPARQAAVDTHCGATVVAGHSKPQLTALQAWGNLVYPIGVVKCFFGDQHYPTAPDPTVSAAIKLGAEVILCYRPTFSGTSGPGGNKPSKQQLNHDQADMVSSIEALQNAGAKVTAVTMYSEPTGTAGLSADQYNYLYKWNYSALRKLARVGCCQSGGAADQIANYFPGPTTAHPSATLYTDGLAVDYYGGNYLSGNKPLSLWTSVADYARVAFGIWESGDSATGGPPLKKAEAKAYITSAGDPVNSMQAVLDNRKANGLPNMHYLWFQNNGGSGPNRILKSGDFRIDFLRTLQQSL